MEWSQVCNDETLRDLPYKIERNEWGNIVMSPASNRHGNIQVQIAVALMGHKPDGTVLTECAVKGVFSGLAPDGDANGKESGMKSGGKTRVPLGMVLAGLLAMVVFTVPGFAETAADGPTWEVGLFATALRMPHYRGSDEAEIYALPLPYVIYRGDFLRVDRDRVAGILFESDVVEASVSFYGNPPVPDDNEARQGMSELDALGEAGPSLRWYPMGKDDGLPYVHAAIRAAISAGFDDGLDLTYRGVRGVVSVSIEDNTLLADWGIGLSGSLGVEAADSRLNGYVYDVEEAYATPERPTFSSGGGYGGCWVAGSVVKRLTSSLALSVYGRWDNITGAAFADSPLVREDNTFIAGTAFIWTIMTSDKVTKGMTAEAQ